MEYLGSKDTNVNSFFEDLKNRIIILSESAWDNRLLWADVQNWLNNFTGLTGESIEIEQLHALYILSQFLYFGSRQIRVLLQSLYRDLFIIPLIQEIRMMNNDTRDISIIKKILNRELRKTKFLGIGNPSESGIHLLYYFRQENYLPKKSFIDVSEIITMEKSNVDTYKIVLSYPNISRYVFIDDICGNGNTAIKYSKKTLAKIMNFDKTIKFYYLTLVGTTSGLESVRKHSVFQDNCRAVFELDSTYKILSDKSRYIASCPEFISVKTMEKLVKNYGLNLWAKNPCGFMNSQLILGLHHNIPNNTIPIIWFHNGHNSWVPIFRRYSKSMGYNNE
jgi:hypothetical protein